jgi:hypothetical protein
MMVLSVILLLLLLLLLSLQRTGVLLLAMEDPPKSRTAEDHLLAFIVETKLLRRLKELSGRFIRSSRM